jgi:hypothetical protein
MFAGAHAVLLRMLLLPGVAPPALPPSPLTGNAHKHTYLNHPLPDFYLQNTCQFAVKSGLEHRVGYVRHLLKTLY